MSKERIMSAAIPPKAIEYYVESLCRPFTRLEDLPLLLMITILYIEIEWILSHYQNLDILVHSMIEILYSNRNMLWSRYRRNHLFFVILVEVLRLSTEAPVDSTSIPLHMWTEVQSLTLKFGREINIEGLLLLEIQMYDIAYKLQRPGFEDSSVGWIFVTWEHNMSQLQRDLKPGSSEMKRLEHMKNRSLTIKMFWNSYHFYINGNIFCGQVLRASVELQVRTLEALPQMSWVKDFARNPLMHVQVFGFVVPRTAYLICYSRDKTMFHRVVKVLSAFRPWISYYDDLIDYLETAVNTELGYHTALEVAYLGPNLPLILFKWQLARVVDQIASRNITELLHTRSLPIPVTNLIE